MRGGNCSRRQPHKLASSALCWLGQARAASDRVAQQLYQWRGTKCLCYSTTSLPQSPCRVRLVLAADPPTCEPTFTRNDVLLRRQALCCERGTCRQRRFLTHSRPRSRGPKRAGEASTAPTTATSQRAAGSPASVLCSVSLSPNGCLGCWTTRSGSPLFTTWCLPVTALTAVAACAATRIVRLYCATVLTTSPRVQASGA